VHYIVFGLAYRDLHKPNMYVIELIPCISSFGY